MKKKLFAVLLAVLLVSTCLFAQSVYEVKHEEPSALPEAGAVVNGFKVVEVRDFDMLGAKIYQFEHIKTKATVLYIANEDTNRFFDIAFRTPAEEDTGVPHVFEHSTLSGSEKYPSKELSFNLQYQTYNTYMNATTYPTFTIYPVGSLSEDQLLALADFYTDSVLHPMVLEDKSIFDTEAWRYVLRNPDDDLTIAGTVYSEMRGAYNRKIKAERNFLGTLFLGSRAGNEYGGNPDRIPDLQWDDLKVYHAKYYHPSNTLSIIYGKLERWSEFLGLLDSYFSAYDYMEMDLRDYGYLPRNGSVTSEFDYPAEAGSDTTYAATVKYGFICGDADIETMNVVSAICDLAQDGSSVLMENLYDAMPYGNFTCSKDFSGPELVIEFTADNVRPEDAALFRSIVDSSMAQIAAEGFDPEAVDTFAASEMIDALLIGDRTNKGVSVMSNITNYWAGTGELYGFLDYLDSSSSYRSWNEDGTFKDVITRYVVYNPCWALVTTKSVAGLQEEKDAALASRLADIKASMSSEEINDIVAATNNPPETNPDTAAMVRKLQVVGVESLPEEYRIYDIEDTTGADGIRRLWAKTDVTDVGYAGIMLDASGLRQDQIHYFKLWTSLIGELDTTSHTRAELSNLRSRYHYDGAVKISVLEDKVSGEMTPRLRFSFTALDEDMSRAFDLMHELLFDNIYDADRIRDKVSNIRIALRQSLSRADQILPLYRAFSTAEESNAYWNYASYIDYYYFIESISELLETEPETVVSALKEIADYFNNSTNGIILFAGNRESRDNFMKIADAFMASLENRPIVRQEYDLNVADSSEAIILENNINYNVIFAPSSVLGYERASGDMTALSAIVQDMYLMPELRDRRGAYGAYIYVEDEGIYSYTYRDPNIADSYAVYDGLADFMENIRIDQETLNGYILATYSRLAIGSGELSGASDALANAVRHEDQTVVLDKMRSLKTMKAESFAQTYGPLFRKLVDNYRYYTTGNASAISKVADSFSTVLDPFGGR